MIETRTSRLAVLCVLFGLLVVLAVWFGTAVSGGPQPGQAPGPDHIAGDAGDYVGRPVQVSGTVLRVDPVVIAAEYEHWTGDRYRTGVLEVTVTGSTATVTPGQHLQAYGPLVSERTVEAENSVVVPAGNIGFMYVVSALAGVWVLARLVRGWTVDRGTLAIGRRPIPLETLASLDPRRSEDSTDA